MKKATIHQLIKSAKQGKQKAITELYNRTKDYAYGVARQYVSESDIADAVQEAYIAAFQNLKSFDENREFLPWLHTITKNKCIDLLKRNNKQAFVSSDIAEEYEDTAPLPLALLEDSQKRTDILNIINGLAVGQRTVVTLYYLEGMGIKEIAEALGITDGTVKKQLYLARRAIKEAVLFEEDEHDNKLYGVGVVPLLTTLLQEELKQGAYTMPQAVSAEVFGGVLSGITTSGIITGGSIGGLVAMTVGGKIAVAAVTAVAVVSTAGAGYLYIEKAEATQQTVAVMAEIAELQEKVEQQGETIKTLETEKTSLLENVEALEKIPSGLSDKEQKMYDIMVGGGIDPDEALAIIGDSRPKDSTPITPLPGEAPTAPEAGTDPPKAPKPPATSKKPINPATNKPWTEAELQDWMDAEAKADGRESGGPLTEQPAGDGAAEDIGSGGYQ